MVWCPKYSLDLSKLKKLSSFAEYSTMAQNSPPQETQPLPPPSYESVVSRDNSISHVYVTPGAPLTPGAPPLDEATAHLDPGAPHYRAR